MNVCMTPCPIVFDLDGTLIDSAPDIHASANLVLREFGISPLTLDRIRSFIGAGVEVLWQRIVAATEADPTKTDDMLAVFMTRYHSANALTRLYPGAEMALGILAARGHRLGICTNKPSRPTAGVLAHFGIQDLFDSVLCGDSLPQRKPDPAPLRACLSELGADPSMPKALYIGDSETDSACAKSAHIPMLLHLEGYRNTPAEELYHLRAFSDFNELPTMVAEFSEA